MKAISLLLYSLPPDREYRIIFMTRQTDEIMASQNDMLPITSPPIERSSDIETRQAFELHLSKVLTWVRGQPNMALLTCDFNQLLNEPMPLLERVRKFVGVPMAIELMRERIDMSLYRHRKRRQSRVCEGSEQVRT